MLYMKRLFIKWVILFVIDHCHFKLNMNRSTINITDLPDEMILTIWNKLNKFDVLYSFLGVNKRFDRMVRDAAYTRSVEFINNQSKNGNCSLLDPILDRFCFYILPQIYQSVECLTLEPLSMERILRASGYPHLRKLTLTKFDQESVLRYITGKKIIEPLHN
jgi:hypothetical protein